MGADAARPSLTRLLSLQGRTAVITGGAQGLGLATGRRLAEAGVNVVLADVRREAAEASAEELRGAGLEASGERLDVTDDRAIVELIARLERLDIWVNNAGIYPITPVFTADSEEWHRVIDVNVLGTYFGARWAAARMARQSGGVVVNVASTAAYRGGHYDLAAYVASKAAVVALTQNLAAAFGRKGVRVLGVAPSLMLTEGVGDAYQQLEKSGADFAHRSERVPLGRIATADDVARVILFCASDLASYLTGITIPVEGGELVTGGATIPGGLPVDRLTVARHD